jgi:xylulokinase
VASPQNAGAVGAAIVAAVGLGITDKIDDAKKLVKVTERYAPKMSNKAVHDRNFTVFKALYRSNKKCFKILNGG